MSIEEKRKGKKRVVISIDDARKDAYTNILPLLQERKIHASLYVTTDYIINPQKYISDFVYEPMKESQLVDWVSKGNEIASHGHEHKNTPEDILQSISILEKWGVASSKIGFASPGSYLTEEGCKALDSLVKNGKISYIRSGVQVRREGLWFTLKYILMTLFSNKPLFYCLYKNMINGGDNRFFLSIPIARKTTIGQVQYFVNHCPDDCIIVLCFHSILRPCEVVVKRDKWYWDYDCFRSLLDWFCMSDEVEVSTMKECVEKGY